MEPDLTGLKSSGNNTIERHLMELTVRASKSLKMALYQIHSHYCGGVVEPRPVAIDDLINTLPVIDSATSAWLRDFWARCLAEDRKALEQEALAKERAALLERLSPREREILGYPRSLVDAKLMDAAATPSFSGGRRNRGMPGGDT